MKTPRKSTNPTNISIENVSTLKVAQLKEMLTSRRKSTEGLKPALIQRLQAAMREDGVTGESVVVVEECMKEDDHVAPLGDAQTNDNDMTSVPNNSEVVASDNVAPLDTPLSPVPAPKRGRRTTKSTDEASKEVTLPPSVSGKKLGKVSATSEEVSLSEVSSPQSKRSRRGGKNDIPTESESSKLDSHPAKDKPEVIFKSVEDEPVPKRTRWGNVDDKPISDGCTTAETPDGILATDAKLSPMITGGEESGITKLSLTDETPSNEMDVAPATFRVEEIESAITEIPSAQINTIDTDTIKNSHSMDVEVDLDGKPEKQSTSTENFEDSKPDEKNTEKIKENQPSLDNAEKSKDESDTKSLKSDKRTSISKKQPDPLMLTGTDILVDRLPPTYNEDDILKLFQKSDNSPIETKLFRDKSGKSFGVMWARFKKSEHARVAVRSLNGQRITIKTPIDRTSSLPKVDSSANGTESKKDEKTPEPLESTNDYALPKVTESSVNESQSEVKQESIIQLPSQSLPTEAVSTEMIESKLSEESNEVNKDSSSECLIESEPVSAEASAADKVDENDEVTVKERDILNSEDKSTESEVISSSKADATKPDPKDESIASKERKEAAVPENPKTGENADYTLETFKLDACTVHPSLVLLVANIPKHWKREMAECNAVVDALNVCPGCTALLCEPVPNKFEANENLGVALVLLRTGSSVRAAEQRWTGPDPPKITVGEVDVSIIKGGANYLLQSVSGLINAVHVNNVPSDVTEQMLKDTFSQFGPIEKLILRPKGGGGLPIDKNNCFSIVNFKTHEQALTACFSMHHKEIGGRKLSVTLAKQSEKSLRRKEYEGRDKVDSGRSHYKEKQPYNDPFLPSRQYVNPYPAGGYGYQAAPSYGSRGPPQSRDYRSGGSRLQGGSKPNSSRGSISRESSLVGKRDVRSGVQTQPPAADVRGGRQGPQRSVPQPHGFGMDQGNFYAQGHMGGYGGRGGGFGRPGVQGQMMPMPQMPIQQQMHVQQMQAQQQHGYGMNIPSQPVGSSGPGRGRFNPPSGASQPPQSQSYQKPAPQVGTSVPQYSKPAQGGPTAAQYSKPIQIAQSGKPYKPTAMALAQAQASSQKQQTAVPYQPLAGSGTTSMVQASIDYQNYIKAQQVSQQVQNVSQQYASIEAQQSMYAHQAYANAQQQAIQGYTNPNAANPAQQQAQSFPYGQMQTATNQPQQQATQGYPFGQTAIAPKQLQQQAQSYPQASMRQSQPAQAYPFQQMAGSAKQPQQSGQAYPYTQNPTNPLQQQAQSYPYGQTQAQAQAGGKQPQQQVQGYSYGQTQGTQQAHPSIAQAQWAQAAAKVGTGYAVQGQQAANWNAQYAQVAAGQKAIAPSANIAGVGSGAVQPYVGYSQQATAFAGQNTIVPGANVAGTGGGAVPSYVDYSQQAAAYAAGQQPQQPGQKRTY